MLGWLLRFYAGEAAMAWNTALVCVLFGSAQMLQFNRQGAKASMVAGGAILAIGLLTGAEHLWRIDLWIDHWLVPSHAPTPLASAMSALIGSALLLQGAAKSSQPCSQAVRFLSLLVLGAGLAALASHLLGISPEYGFGLVTKMSSLASAGMALAGAGLLGSNIYWNRVGGVDISGACPAFVCSAILLATLAFGASLLAEKRYFFARSVREQMVGLRYLLEAQLEDSMQDFSRIARRWAARGGTPESEWREDALAYLQDKPYLQAIAWVDASGCVRWVEPLKGWEELAGSDFFNGAGRHSAFEKLRAERRVVVEEAALPGREGTSSLFLVPLVVRDRVEGLLAAIVDPQLLMQKAAAFMQSFDYQFSLSLGVAPRDGHGVWAQSGPVCVWGNCWHLALWPTPEKIRTETSSTLIQIYVVMGSILSVAAGYLTYLMRREQMQLRTIHGLKEQMDMALGASAIGTWTWDVLTGRMSGDARATALLGLPSGAFPSSFQELLNCAPLDAKGALEGQLREMLARGASYDLAFQAAWPDGTRRFLRSRGKVLRAASGEVVRVVGALWDASAEHVHERSLACQMALTKALSESTSLSQVFPHILQALGEGLEMAVINLWRLDRKRQLLFCKEGWHAKEREPSSFEEVSHKSRFAWGEGLPGRVWVSEEPVWIGDLAKDANFPRYPFAADSGLVWGLAFPLFEQERFFGVIELFHHRSLQEGEDKMLIGLARQMGQQISAFIHRRRLEEERASLGAIVEGAEDGIIGETLEGVVTSWNLGAEKVLGYTAEEIVGTSSQRLYPMERLPELEMLLAHARKGEQVGHFETQRMRKDGTLVWVDVAASPVINLEKQPSGCCLILRDVTLRKQAERAKEEAEERFRAFVETTGEWIWEVDLKGVLTYSNPAVATLLGYVPEEVVGRERAAFLAVEDAAAFKSALLSAAAQKRPITSLIARCMHREGSERWLESSLSPLCDKEGRVVGFQGADRDVTERQEQDKARNAFISSVSHELRTPLASLQGVFGLLANLDAAFFTSQGKSLLALGLRKCLLLAAIVQELFELERLETGRESLDVKPTKIATLLQEAVMRSQTSAQEAGVTIELHLQASEGALVRADPDRLLQVFNHLISNAIKFSPKGKVVAIQLAQVNSCVRVAVADQGVGIPPEFQKHLFEKFSSAKSYTPMEQRGAGLGLCFSKLVIDKLGGTLSVTSQLGAGTTFFVELPLVKET
jgi:PAS domain S-box-containing protein